jgi:hypothetical protein
VDGRAKLAKPGHDGDRRTEYVNLFDPWAKSPVGLVSDGLARTADEIAYGVAG